MLFLLYGWTTALTIAQELLRMANFKLRNQSLQGLIGILGLAYLVQFAAFIMNHVYRLRHEGRVCSGSFLTE